MPNLSVRIFSAVIATIVLFSLVYFYREQGIYFLGVVVVAKGILEQTKLFFNTSEFKILKYIFIGTCFIGFWFILNLIFERSIFISVVAIFVVSNCLGLFFHKKFTSILDIQIFSSRFISGFIYTVIMPSLILSLLKNPYGLFWFFCLLAVVFSGDIGAYLFGTLWGKTKLAPELSPKKSLQGSLGGLVFSSLAGVSFYFIIPDVSIYVMLGLGLFGGLLGQVGDFYESLMKRIAGVKDSGSIMPGHGGVLDRLDGLYFASPLFYVVINYIIY
jgi:phosphatidate cytidylyltransferase